VNPAAVLAARPALEEVVADYEEMLARIRVALEAELGPLGWRRFRDRTPSTCGHDFPYELGGRSVHLAPWGFDAPVADRDWPRARRAVAEVAAGYGFVTAGLQIDGPGRHVAGGIDPVLGASYDFGTQRATTLQVSTGCHLPAVLLPR
jgi:Lipoprotein confined to pathogenic Mycobacterium